MPVNEATIADFPKKKHKQTSLISQTIDFAGSVRFGIILLILLGVICLVGMLIPQQNAAGFEGYFVELSPLQQILFGLLGLFDIYHTWYFLALLFLLSLNIILSSVDRFPATWKFISKPKIAVSKSWLEKQPSNYSVLLQGEKSEVRYRIANACKINGWSDIIIKENREKTVVFAQSGGWNRFCAYPVHLGLLTILFGGFVSSQLSFSGEIPLTIGQSSSKIQSNKLPFSITCNDFEQNLINPKGSIETSNTLDWKTNLKITDENGTTDATVSLNRPFDYRGYRIFHSNFLPIGKARSITIQAEHLPQITLKQNEEKVLADGTKIGFVDFRANFSLERETINENSINYQNPAAVLEITTPNGLRQTEYAWKGNQKFELINFEKVSEQHILFVRYDPGANIVYAGFVVLILSLFATFFFSHQRLWIVIEEISAFNFMVTIGGNSNRNQARFENKFRRFIRELL